jgi:ubiquitin-conjugating enzyme E2 M
MDPPKLNCLNRIYHPNISYKGNVCLPLVREDFAPTVTLTSIICGLIYILTYPNAEDALNPEIGDLMIKDYEMFKKIVYHTVEGRVFKNF